MSGYFARLAASHGAGTAPGSARAAAPPRMSAAAGADDALPEVNMTVDAAAPTAATAPALLSTPAHAAAAPAAPAPAPRAAAPPIGTPASISAPTLGSASPHVPHTEVQHVTHIVSRTAPPPAPAPLKPRRTEWHAPSPRAAAPKRSNGVAEPATHAAAVRSLSSPAAAMASAPNTAPVSATPAPAHATTHIESHTVIATSERSTRAEARVAPAAPVIAPARETQVHIGRVELVVSAPAPPAPRRATAASPAQRAARAPAATRDEFSVHRHYLRVP